MNSRSTARRSRLWRVSVGANGLDVMPAGSYGSAVITSDEPIALRSARDRVGPHWRWGG